MTALPPAPPSLLPPPVPHAPPPASPDAIVPILTTSTAHVSAPTSDSDVSVAHTPRCLAKPAIRVTLLSVLVIVFAISLTFAVRSWISYERVLSSLRWDRQACRIESKRVAVNPSMPSQYRVEANVTGRSPLTVLPQLAFSGPSRGYRWSRSGAEEELKGVKIGQAECWVKRSDVTAISVREVDVTEGEEMSAKGGLYVAWIMTFVAAFVGMLTVTLVSHWMHEFLVRVIGGGTEDGEGRKNRAGLSREQARWLCDRLGDGVKGRGEGDSDWVCSICLEDDEEEGIVRTVVLVCGHRFHRECIRKWLRRGRAACPLCHWDAKSLFDAAGNPKPDALEGTGRETGDEREIGREEEAGEGHRGREVAEV